MAPTLPRPALLAGDNFQRPEKTPWGGTRLSTSYKRGLVRGADARIGESWEFSVAPERPCRLVDGRLLDEVIRADRSAWLGPAASASTELLVKLVDAADDLSVQIHPDDDYDALAPDECGKPECWYVVERDEGAGLYVGLAEGVDRDRLRTALERDEDVSALLAFVRVEPGDFFLIEAGTPHAIGKGLLLVEPQRVRPGKHGVTYRYWDWNRRYDANGHPSASGTKRPLHVEHALAVTRFDTPRGEAAWPAIRHRAGTPDRDAPARREVLAGPEGPVRSPHFVVERIAGHGALDLPSAPYLRAVTVLDGSVAVPTDGGTLVIERGRSAVLPASLPHVELALDRAHALVSAIA